MNNARIGGLLVLVASVASAACLTKSNPFYGEPGTGGASGSSSGAGTTATSTTSSSDSATSGTVGSGSSDGGSTATSVATTTATGGAPMALLERGLLVRYYLDEADGGQGPDAAFDAAPDPLDLDVRYQGDSNLHYAVGAGGRGLWFDAAEGTGRVCAVIDGTKVATLTGSTQVTLELVVEPQAVTNMYSRFLHIGEDTEGGNLTLSTDVGDAVSLVLDADNTTQDTEFPITIGTRAVWHFVFDSTETNAADFVRFYVDGLRQNALVDDVVTPGQALDLEVDFDTRLCLGNRFGSSRSYQGGLYYAAIYDVALEAGEVTQNADVLGLDDDTP